MKKKSSLLVFIPGILFALITPGAFADVITDWNLITLSATKKAGQNSNFATRTIAIEAIAVYDAVNSIKQFGTPYQYNVPAEGNASAQAAAAQAAYNVLLNFFPEQKAELDVALSKSLDSITDGPVGNGTTVGAAAASAILALRANDGSLPDISYPHPASAKAGEYRLTPPLFKPGINQQWGNVKPFALASTNQFFPQPPPSYGSDEYKNALAEVENLGATGSSLRTNEQTHIAQFWKQDAELGVNEAARELARSHKTSLENNALIFILVAIAAADARIEVWAAKYRYLFWRPLTALNADTIGSVNNNYTKWDPLIATPAHPDYPSGHSATVTAGFDVLKFFFGDKNTLVLHTTTPGEPSRTIQSLSDGESENGLSRIYGGIHYSFDNSSGQKIGRQVAQYVLEKGPKKKPAKK
jgi:PAP2 superfamily